MVVVMYDVAGVWCIGSLVLSIVEDYQSICAIREGLLI